jgi:drug/metabolite transporter (DMT)-like permease
MSYMAVLAGIVKWQAIQSRRQLIKVALVGLVFCWSLVLGNTSLQYIPISFNQAIGSTTPFFTAIFSVIMTHKVETKTVYLTLVPVVAGICIASGFEPSFHVVGFTCCLLATAARAFKSVLQVRRFGVLLCEPLQKYDHVSHSASPPVASSPPSELPFPHSCCGPTHSSAVCC